MFVSVLALMLVGFCALIAAVVTGSLLWAWVCMGLCVVGVLLLGVDGWRGRGTRGATDDESGARETASRADGSDDQGTA